MDGILVLYKSTGLTSMDLIRKTKREFCIKKLGHAGTLDPMASGILPVLIGEATKFTNLLHNKTKKYRFSVEFGKCTDSYDAEGKMVRCDGNVPTRDAIMNAVSKFVGNIMQIPPKFSACKVDGRRAYDLARKDVDFQLAAKEISIKSLILEEYNAPFATFFTECSSGTYVRSLAVDIAESVNCLCYVTKLIRTNYWYFDHNLSGEFISLNNVKWENKIELSDQQYENLKYGRIMECECNDGEFIGFYNGDVVGIVIVCEGILSAKRMLKFP